MSALAIPAPPAVDNDVRVGRQTMQAIEDEAPAAPLHGVWTAASFWAGRQRRSGDATTVIGQ